MEVGRFGVDRLALQMLARPWPRSLKGLDHVARSDLRMVLVRQVGKVAPDLMRRLAREFSDLFHRRRAPVKDVAEGRYVIESSLEVLRRHHGHAAWRELLPEHRGFVKRGVTAKLHGRGKLDGRGDLFDQQPVPPRMRLIVEIGFRDLRPIDAHYFASTRDPTGRSTVGWLGVG